MRWILVILIMCNGIYFLWQSHLQQEDATIAATSSDHRDGRAVPQLVLLAELSGVEASTETNVGHLADDRVFVGESSEATAKVAEESAPGICWLVGPFAEEVSARQVIGRLRAMEMTLELESIEIEGDPDYWVHIPPLVSRKAAIRLLRELQSKEIDSFLITDGELAQGLSLGFFTQQSRAQDVLNHRSEQGYEAEIKVVARTYSELWGVFDTRKYGELTEILWRKIKEGNKDLQRRKNYCDRIASVDNLD